MHRALAMVMCATLAAGGIAIATELPNIRHRPIQYYVPGHRVEVLTSVSDQSGVDVVRCYFRQKGSPTYMFVDMQPVGGDQFRGVLPAPEDGGGEIEYRFLVLTGNRCVFTTEAFTMEPANDRQAQKTPRWQQVPEGDPVDVRVDASAAPAGIPGFDDVLALTATPPERQFSKITDLDGHAPEAAPESEDRQPPGGFGLADLFFCGVIPAAAVSSGGLFGSGPGGIGPLGPVIGAAAVGGGIAGGVAAADSGGSSSGSGSGAGVQCALVSGGVNLPPNTSAAPLEDSTTLNASTQIGAQTVLFVDVNFTWDNGGSDPEIYVLDFGGMAGSTVDTVSVDPAMGTRVIRLLGNATTLTIDTIHIHAGVDLDGSSWSAVATFFCQ